MVTLETSVGKWKRIRGYFSSTTCQEEFGSPHPITNARSQLTRKIQTNIKGSFGKSLLNQFQALEITEEIEEMINAVFDERVSRALRKAAEDESRPSPGGILEG